MDPVSAGSPLGVLPAMPHLTEEEGEVELPPASHERLSNICFIVVPAKHEPVLNRKLPLYLIMMLVLGVKYHILFLKS